MSPRRKQIVKIILGAQRRGGANQEIEISIKAIINSEFGVCSSRITRRYGDGTVRTNGPSRGALYRSLVDCKTCKKVCCVSVIISI